jgi:glycerophosphoryl diester phosphodiesterase
MTLTAPPSPSRVPARPVDGPLVIGHRGAAGYRPEHTLASYLLAIEQGADYIEPDLVSTRDGVLVARHENQIGATTDVADHPELARRHTAKSVNGRTVSGWFTEDFTLAELKSLRAKERLPRLRPANTWYDGRFDIPTLDEILELARDVGRRRGVAVGVYPETKNPSYFASIGLSLEEPLVAALRRFRLDRPDAPVLVQSFETANLRELAEMTAVPLVQLVDASGSPYDLQRVGDPRSYADLLAPAGLREISTYAGAIGLHHGIVLRQPAIVAAAHGAGLSVHAWTVRDEHAPGLTEELLGLGVDGVFADQPDTAVAARERWRSHGAPVATSHAVKT